MKKSFFRQIAVFMALLMIVVSAPVSSANAFELDQTSEDGFVFRSLVSDLIILDYVGEAEHLVVPTEIYGQPVTSIANNAFNSAHSIKTAFIPASIDEVGTGVFVNCVNLEAVYVEEGHKSLVSVDGVIYSKDMKNLILYPSGKKDEVYTIPDTVETISTCAFFANDHLAQVNFPSKDFCLSYFSFYNCNGLTEINLPEGFKKINISSFVDCERIKEFNLPLSLEYYEPGAILGCNSLKNVNIPSKNTFYNSHNGVLYTKSGREIVKYPEGKPEKQYTVRKGTERIQAHAFSSAYNIEYVHLLDGVRIIEDFAFADCRNLLSMRFPDTLTSINGPAFDYCQKLEFLHFPLSLNTVGQQAFQECINIKYVHYAGTEKDFLNISGMTYNEHIMSATIIYKDPDDTKPEPQEQTLFYFADTLDWGGVNIYYWDETDQLVSYPGDKMTYVFTDEFGVDIYVGYVPSNAIYFVFTSRNGEMYTSDILKGSVYGIFSAKRELNSFGQEIYTPYIYNGGEITEPVTYPSEPTEPTGGTDPTDIIFTDPVEDTSPVITTAPVCTEPEYPYDTVKVYFENRLDWYSVYIYYWGSELTDEILFPGEPMLFSGESINGADVYYKSVPADVEGIIFVDSCGTHTSNITQNILDGSRFTAERSDDAYNAVTLFVPDITEILTDPVEVTEVTEEVASSPSITTTTADKTEVTTSLTSTQTQTVTFTEPVKYISGDVNLDFKVNIKDATLIQKFVAKIKTLDRLQLGLADADSNSKVNIKDATFIQKKIAGIIQ